jgi:pyruvate kinase
VARLQEGLDITLTIRKLTKPQPNTLSVNYEGFVDDIQVGDTVVVDGGMVTLEVMKIAGPDVLCSVVDPGLILSRANLTFRNKHGGLIRGKNSSLPVITAKVPSPPLYPQCLSILGVLCFLMGRQTWEGHFIYFDTN